MYIKIINCETKSDWMKHSGKQHKVMLQNPPESVEIRIEDFYPRSPDKGETEIISFTLFNLLARTYFLQQQAEEKQDSRNVDSYEAAEDQKAYYDLEEIVQLRDDLHKLSNALDTLTELQRRRITMRFDLGLTFKQIADIEVVKWQTVQKRINESINKLKKQF